MILYAPPGIGDVYWLLMKLIPSTQEKIEVKVASAENERASFLSCIEGVEVSTGNFSILRNKKLAAMKRYSQLEGVMYLEANTHLESGQRIEKYLPELNTSFRLNWKTTRDGYWRAKQYLAKNTIAIHTSSMKHNQLNNIGIGPTWDPDKWIQIVQSIYGMNGGIDVVWVGAKYDIEMFYLLRTKFPQMKAVVQESPDVVINFLRNCDAFISYQSGLSVISVCEGIPTYMLYFDWLKDMPNTFCPVSSIGNQIYGYGHFDTCKVSDPAEWLFDL